MIVYVESNFVLELAYQQEQNESCEELLRYTSEHNIPLVIPAFCLIEPLVAWSQRSARRKEIADRLSRELSELGRSKPYNELVLESSTVTSRLVQSTEEEKARLDNTLDNIASMAHVIPMDFNIMEAAKEYRGQLSLSPQDSVAYASVLDHLRNNNDDDKCFLNKNSKDFMIPEIEDELSSLNCRIIPSFGNGLDYIKTRIGGSS